MAEYSFHDLGGAWLALSILIAYAPPRPFYISQSFFSQSQRVAAPCQIPHREQRTNPARRRDLKRLACLRIRSLKLFHCESSSRQPETPEGLRSLLERCVPTLFSFLKFCDFYSSNFFHYSSQSSFVSRA